ncbi:glycosyltransferase family 4 protein [Geodermatophilus ruber]|uniref:Glycosyltransferase involved in cell wall bisynthesis n=1 Tax=Geodermatophilus ruber TaxID=504800 RepID=A0A1I4BS60_9ACTN|nr:glycosyltransferase family 4 protein [Geodermatophilus ruber]SFK70711.1 Glycosyltransferase involved in cell wall bisynthesis [Geodermatophilus ruber]
MTERVRVLQVIGITVGGSAEHLLQLSSLLPADRFEVTVALSGGGPLDDEIRATGLRVLDFAPSHGAGHFKQASPDSPWELLRQFGRLRADIRRHRYDVVHTHTSVAGAMGRVAAWSCRTPVRLHMVHAFAGHDAVRQPMRTLFRLVERALDLVTTHTVVGSVFMRDLGLRWRVLRPGRVTVIPNASRMAVRDGTAAERDRLRSELGLPPDALLIALIGRVEDQKGVDALVRAAVPVTAHVPRAHVVVVGDGTRRAGMERLAVELGIAGRVHFTGWRHDLGDVLRAIDVLALPSRWEAFGIVNLEAMAAAKPVVGYAVGGIPEVVVHGETGLLSPPGAEDDLARDLVRVLTDPQLAARLGAAGRRRLLERFAPERMVQAHVELYEELVARARRRRLNGGPRPRRSAAARRR